MSRALDKFRLDRTQFSVANLGNSDELEFWLSKTPQERWEAAELLRRIAYGYDPMARIERTLEVVVCPWG